MSSIPRRRPKNSQDLISFDKEVLPNSPQVSEIRRLFDPLYTMKIDPSLSCSENSPALLSTKADLSSELWPFSTYGLTANHVNSVSSPRKPTIAFDAFTFNIINGSAKSVPHEASVNPLTDLQAPSNPSFDFSSNDSETFSPRTIESLETGGPSILRRRWPLNHHEQVFLPKCQSSIELEMFSEAVESIRIRRKRETNSSQPTDLLLSSVPTSDSPGCTTEDDVCMPFDPVYGELASTDLSQNPKSSQIAGKSPGSRSYRIRDPLWSNDTGARRVSHVHPIRSRTGGFEGEAPSHWKNSPRWSIPQLEVRVTVYLGGRRRRTPASSGGIGARKQSPSSRPDDATSQTPPQNPTLPLAPRIRLVCDPNSTLVSELMLEVLVSDPLPQDLHLNANDFQLRLHGRAELLHPDSRLCDCNQVQLCHRLDIPLRLILEPKERNVSHQSSESERQESFDPQALLQQDNQRVPNEEEIFITHSIFENAMEKVRSCISDAETTKSLQTLLADVRCAISGLAQSVKAVLAMVCQSIAFPDVLDALGAVQMSVMDALKNISSADHTQAMKHCFSDGLMSSIRRHGKHSAPSIGFSTADEPSSLRISQSKRDKVHYSLAKLESALFHQLSCFFDWLQAGVRISPNFLRPCMLKNLRSDSLPALRPRPKGVVLVADTLTESTVKDAKLRELRSSDTCTDPFVVELIAIHRAPRSACHATGSSESSTLQHDSTQNYPERKTNAQPRLDANFRVIVCLIYAGRRLGSIYPRDRSAYGFESTRSSGDSSMVRDCFVSDPGCSLTIQPGFPRVLRFDQTFTFPGFLINQLPREALISISLFSCKRTVTENPSDWLLHGWVNVPLFQPDGRLRQGTMVAGLWPPDESLNPYRPTWSQPNHSSDCAVVQLHFPQHDFDVEFPILNVDSEDRIACLAEYESLVPEARQAVSEAQCAIFLHSISTELSADATERCLSRYSEAVSATHRTNRKCNQSPSLPSLRLGALSNTVLGHPASRPSGINTLDSVIDTLLPSLTRPPALAVNVLWNLRWYLTCRSDPLCALLSSVLITWPQEAHGSGAVRHVAWSWVELLRKVYQLLGSSTAPPPGVTLRLLASDVPDQGIRHWAVRALAAVPPDTLLHYIPQALETINFDLYLDYSGIASLLLQRASSSMRFANALFWHLNTAVRTSCTECYSAQSSFDTIIWRCRRFLIIKSALMHLSSPRLRTIWMKQEEAIEKLSIAATAVKQTKANSAAREKVLHRHMQSLMQWLNLSARRSCFVHPPHFTVDEPPSSSSSNHPPQPLLIDIDGSETTVFGTSDDVFTTPSFTDRPQQTSASADHTSIEDIGLRMPYNPGLLTHRLDIAACTYFTSFTCPLRLVFHTLDAGSEPIMVMFKDGDDLRQDSLIIQLMFLMDRVWLEAGLDLRMIHFRIVPTGDRKGLIELVSECSTLRQIQQQGGGITGPFKESVITTWLQTQNATELDYKRALENFLRSLAGCCVITYVLGIGDRHNDNIMIRYSGHLFHVDFAKVFGNVQTFAGIKRDRVPFVFTPDMLHVLQTYSKEMSNGAGIPLTSGFGNTGSNTASNNKGVQLFIDYCCEAYNLIRRHAYTFLSILDISLSMGIPGITRDCVRFVLRTLKLEHSDQQASQHFTELIRKSLHSKIPALNFFVHGLAQAKQSSTGGGISGTASSNSFDTDLTTSGLDQVVSHRYDGCGGSKACPPLSFCPKRFSFNDDSPIDAVMTEAAVKKRSGDKHPEYYFPISVWRKDCRVPTRIFRRLSDLSELCSAVRDTFPKSPILPTLALMLNSVNANSVTSVRTQNNVQELLDCLLEEDESVTKSDLVCTFFHSLLFDERFAAEEAAQLNNASQATLWAPSPPSDPSVNGGRNTAESKQPLLTPAFLIAEPTTDTVETWTADSRPALQLELNMSESARQLVVLVKHGRGLRIPGSNELPDIYAKVYLLSGRRKKSTKRKTGVIRRSDSPSFNTAFTYELCPNDVQVGFLEVSAWHVVNLGDNFSLGQAYIQLRSLRPGQTVTKWYSLSSDWEVV